MSAPAYIPSPCIGICTLEDQLCIGCFRTSNDILHWSRWSDTQRQAALTQRDQALQHSFDALFHLDDEDLLWHYWDAQVGWAQRPGSAIEAWLQALLESTEKNLPDALSCGVSGRFSLQTQLRQKAVDIWLKQFRSLREASSGSVE